MDKYLNDIFDKREKPISESSRKLYIHNLKKLNNGDEIKNLNFLEKPSETIKKINHLSANTQKSYLIAICTILKNSDKQKLYEDYFNLMKDSNKSLTINTEKSETQKQNWSSKEEIENLRESLKKSVPKTKIATKTDYDNLLNYLLVSLFTLIQPRRNIDFTMMYISNDMTDTSKNYLNIKNKQFIFNNYKTSGTYKQIIIDIPDDLFAVIKLYLKNHILKDKLKNKKHSILFLLTADGSGFSSDKITKQFHKIFGKKISSSMLRNIFLTDKYSNVIKSLENDTAAMSTSVKTAMNNYIKKN